MPLPSKHVAIQTPMGRYRDLISKIAQEHDSTYEEIRGPNRSAHLVNIRRKIAKTLRTKHKLSFPRIGFYMNRDHSSIQNLLRPKKDRYVPGSRRKKRGAVLALPYVPTPTLDELLAEA